MLSPTFKTFSGRCRRNRPASSVASAAQLGERTEMGWGKTEMGWGKTEMGWGKSAKGQRWAGERVRKLETWCLTSTETTRLIRDGERGRGDLEERNLPVKTEETASHRQNNDVKEVGTPPVRSNLCTSLFEVSTTVRNKVT